MQRPQKENKKLNRLPPFGNTPQVLTPTVLSPHDIERQQHLQQIASLQILLCQQQTINARHCENLKWAGKCIKILEENFALFTGNGCLLKSQSRKAYREGTATRPV